LTGNNRLTIEMGIEIETPETTEDLLQIINRNINGNFRFGAGYTDLVLELKQEPQKDLLIINLAQMDDSDFTTIQFVDEGIRIGALTTIAEIMTDKKVRHRAPVVVQAAENFASRQIREVATVGGNICTASPAGDMSCALTALEASCEILNVEGDVRSVPIAEFFSGVKQTVLRAEEVLRSVVFPLNRTEDIVHSRFVKVGVRNAMEIAIVSLAFHVLANNDGNVTSSGVAIGSVAPTIKFARSACDFLAGKNLSRLTNNEREKFATMVLDCASPITDLRASEWYRREVLWNICGDIFND